MTPLLATQPALERTDVSTVDFKATQFQVTVVPANAPWLYSALEQLRELKRHGGVIAGIGDLRISDQTELRTQQVLSHIALPQDLPCPTLSVFSGGGVSLTWQLGSREVAAKVFPQGVVVGSRIDDDELLDDFEVPPSSDSRLTEYLKWMIAKR